MYCAPKYDIRKYAKSGSSDHQLAVWVCLHEEGPYRAKDLIRIFRSNTKEMGRILSHLEGNEMIWSGMKGKTKWYGVTEGSSTFIEAMIAAVYFWA